MFAEHGEAVFRRRERMAIEELMSMPDTVFATGGGLPCYTDTMDHLLEAGHGLYLRCSYAHSSLPRLEPVQAHAPDDTRQEWGRALCPSCRTPSPVREPIYSRAHRTCEIDHVDTPQKEQLFALELAKELAR